MQPITQRDAVNRIGVMLGAGFSTIGYGLDVVAGGDVGVIVAAPALLGLAVAAADAHRERKADDGLPDGVTEVNDSA